MWPKRRGMPVHILYSYKNVVLKPFESKYQILFKANSKSHPQGLLMRLQDQQENIDKIFENYNDIDRDWREEKIKQPSHEMLQLEHEMQGMD